MKTKNDAILRDARPADPVATAGNLSVFIPPETRILHPANPSSDTDLICLTGVIDCADCIHPENLVNLCFRTLKGQDAGSAEGRARVARCWGKTDFRDLSRIPVVGR
jgi:hypothetical protein